MPKAKVLAGTMTVDIHEMNAVDAKKYLERLIASCSAEVKEIEVIHGYRGGSSLMETVRTGVKSKRIARRCVSLNPGVTTYFLKEIKK